MYDSELGLIWVYFGDTPGYSSGFIWLPKKKIACNDNQLNLRKRKKITKKIKRNCNNNQGLNYFREKVVYAKRKS